jgi:hypothetical protein
VQMGPGGEASLRRVALSPRALESEWAGSAASSAWWSEGLLAVLGSGGTLAVGTPPGLANLLEGPAIRAGAGQLPSLCSYLPVVINIAATNRVFESVEVL